MNLFVVFVLGVCLWLVPAGVLVAVFAPNGAPGVALVVTGILIAGCCVEWLMEHSHHR